MEPQWLTYAKRLQAIASTGLHFSKDPYDRERFDEIASIANEILATLGDVPIDRIEGLISDFARGYATPRVDVRGAIIEDDAILLVRERSDSLWTLPGGFADVGRSAAQNIEKEMLEEAGLRVTARRLYAVRYKASGSYSADVRDFYKMFFLCDRVDCGKPATGAETSEVGFFRLNELPPLSRARVLESDIEAAFAFSADAQKPAFFD
ncbi:NUDIX hydrolase [Bradyrhizobium sp. 183]|uniref:NUDIX hydrolase n=1 Tax=unclassified Bradyrhizobium TaxID=2631580 RepID=UPI001FFFEB24|nr:MULTISPECIES: NUDIX hydrolase [unclassified Bradyrhizobium]UPJ79795.1 NUDIX hydrolase [Bradyrhizobium sp. 184]UPJ87590.1 NUDIX hydrolase [Bradyrhizobium sp. 183]